MSDDAVSDDAVSRRRADAPEERRALFRVVRGEPTDAELAALTVVLAAVAATRAGRRARWSARRGTTRPPGCADRSRPARAPGGRPSGRADAVRRMASLHRKDMSSTQRE